MNQHPFVNSVPQRSESRIENPGEPSGNSTRENSACSEVCSIDDAQGQLLTIGAMARLCDVTVRTLRYYEEMDLIGPVKRSTGKYRLYSHRTIKRVKAILALQDLNYSLEEIVVTLGPYSKTMHFTKKDQIQATRQSLELQKVCIESKLEALLQLKEDINTRLHTLDTLCSPCVQQTPEAYCQEDCSHRDIHMN
ncbi:MAG: MerR family transcriptional regulator [Cyanobacteria bacterium]|nr:MerR family transcriptional regulator [Cyanobacteriota bacterium]